MAKQQTKQMLTEAFFSLYKEKAINRISIKDITEKAGFHRSTFYEYYTDIYDLLEQEEQEIFSLQKELILKPVQSGTLAIGENSFLSPLKKLFQQKGERIILLIGVNGDASFRRTLQERIKTAIMPQVESSSGFHAEYIAEFLSSGILSTCEMAYKNQQDIEDIMTGVYPFVSKIFR